MDFVSFLFFFVALTRTFSTMLRNGESTQSRLVPKLNVVGEVLPCIRLKMCSSLLVH